MITYIIVKANDLSVKLSTDLTEAIDCFTEYFPMLKHQLEIILYWNFEDNPKSNFHLECFGTSVRMYGIDI